MKILKKGYTLVEVMLFVAISGALLAGVIISTTSTIDKQRYSTATDSFMDFIRTVYSEVVNPKNPNIGGGKSNTAIYGKLVTFNETKDDEVRTYTVIGDKNNQKGSTVRDALELLKDMSADIGDNDHIYEEVINNMTWDIEIQKPNGEKFKGAILIVHSPASGVVYTYVAESAPKIQSNNERLSGGKGKIDNFTTEDVSLCIAPKGMWLYGGNRYEVRMTKNSHDPSSIILRNLDDNDNRCSADKVNK